MMHLVTLQKPASYFKFCTETPRLNTSGFGEIRDIFFWITGVSEANPGDEDNFWLEKLRFLKIRISLKLKSCTFRYH